MIVSRTPCSTDQDTVPDDQLVKPVCYDTITCNSRDGDLPDLETVVDGASWVLSDYFQQQLYPNDTLHHQDPNLSPVYQQFDRIRNYTVKVIEPLSSNIEEGSNVATVTGSSLFNKWFSPNVGDAFVVQLADGPYIFRVRGVNASTYRRDPSYIVSYIMVERLDRNGTTWHDLVNKTDQEMVFDSTLADQGSNPLVPASVQKERTSLIPYMIAAADDYFKRFTDQRTGLLLIQIGDISSVYDPFLTDYMRSTVPLLGNRFRREIRAVPINQRSNTKYNIFDFMTTRRLIKTEHMCDRFCTVSRRNFRHHRDLSHFSQYYIDYMVSAIDTSAMVRTDGPRGTCPDRNISDVDCMPLSDMCKSCGTDSNSDIDTDYIRLVSVDGSDIRTIKSPSMDSKYVFSEDFYTESSNQSLLEVLTRRYLKNESINISELILLWSDYKNWCQLSRFYYTGILLQLSHYTMLGNKCP